MDITVKMILPAQQVQRPVKLLHRIVRRIENPGAQKQALNIIPPVKLHRQAADLLRCKGGPHRVITPAVNAIAAVVNALVGIQNL